jgi:hypothetical protein
MPKEGEVIKSENEADKKGVSQTLTLLAQKVLGGDNAPPLTAEQMDKFIE